jgi:hypothetical protein
MFIYLSRSIFDEMAERIAQDWRREEWKLSVRSYRSTLGQLAPERTMCALTMNDNVFVFVDDPFAPTRADLAAERAAGGPAAEKPDPPHYKYTFLTLTPPGALEQLLTQLRARWATSKQNVTGGGRQQNAQQLTIDGAIYTIGTDVIVRAGNIVLNGNTVKGMLLEVRRLRSKDSIGTIRPYEPRPNICPLRRSTLRRARQSCQDYCCQSCPISPGSSWAK